MYHLIYTSHAVAPLSQHELIDLLAECREFNKKHHVTGMLLYLRGKFIQVLEGEKEVIIGLYEGIRSDPRHERVMTIIEGNSPVRFFKNWSMGFKQLTNTEFAHITSFKDIDRFFKKEGLGDDGSLLMTFLKLFYKKNIVDYSELPGA